MPDRRPPLPTDPAGMIPVARPGGAARQPAPMLLVMIGGLVSTLVLVFLVSQLEDRTARADLAALAEQRFSVLDANLARAVDALADVGAYFDADSGISRREFAALVQPVLHRQPALRALEWAPYTPADRLAATRAAVRGEGYPGFEIGELGNDGALRPVGPRAEYFPVVYVEPLAGNERAFGFDLGSQPSRFKALDQARRQGRLLATARINLVQEGGHPFGILLLRPVYRGAGGDSPPAGRALLPPDPGALRGFVLGVFKLSELIGAGDPARHAQALEIYVFDQPDQPGESLLYPADAGAVSPASLARGVSFSRALAVGGRSWTVVARPSGGLLRVDRTASEVVAVAGVLLTILLAMMQEQNRSRTRAIEQTVAERTADLRESERRLIQANHEAVQANRMKTMFLASMSHEFRTPMNAILGLLHVLSRTPLEAGQRDYLEKISSAARRLLRLIDDILDVSRIEAGKLSVERETFRIEAVLRDVLVAVAPKLRDKRVELVLDLDPAMPAQLIGDGMRITQVLVNLADNAAKFTQEGEIVLALDWLPGSAPRLRVELRDTGPGLSEPDQRAVFLPFVQTENTHRRTHGGSGLGLAICRQLVNLMGGEIQLESHPGQGSRFWFELPLAAAAELPVASPPPAARPPSVLLVEPHAGAARALRRQLEAFGCPVQVAADGGAAAVLLETQGFDLVLLNPQAGGEQVLAELPLARRPARMLRLLAIGASLHGGDAPGMLEKPLLPGLLAAVLFPVEREHAAVAEPARPVAPRPEARVVASPAVAGGDHPYSELQVLASRLRDLLERGDPEAERAARALARWAEGSRHAEAAADLQRRCSDYDFREALEALDELCPPAAQQEK